MKVESTPQPLFDSIGRSARTAGRAVEQDLRAAQPRRSGRLAASTGVVETASAPDEVAFTVVTSVPYGGAVERGADVGARRGPHMKGQHVIANVAPGAWERRMSDALKAGR